jgi:hypothetical protein
LKDESREAKKATESKFVKNSTMKNIISIKIISVFVAILFFGNLLHAKPSTVERWNVFEVELKGPSAGNPFMDVDLSATFAHDSTQIEVNGFYDGDGTYKIRFMPTQTGEWSFITQSNVNKLDKQKGSFTCVPATGQNHGPVQVANTFHFKYDDGTPYFPIGTTAYVWHHQSDSLVALTLETLKSSPFNKIRMCVFPKKYKWCMNEPRNYPYEGTPPNKWDLERFNPEYFRELEENVLALGKLGIEADLILFHPYDYNWGFDEMDREKDLHYLKYLLSRMSSFRNVWWSMGNEFDLIKNKTEYQWDYYFQYIVDQDPYGHLRSNHNGPRWYDHSKPWITHLSIQHQNIEEVAAFRNKYKKPVLVDECGYEGILPAIWGNLTAKEMVHRFWLGYSRGGYVTHGETYPDENEVIFWAKGGDFKGESVERIEFLKKIVDTFPKNGIDPTAKGYWSGRGGSFSEPDFYLFYLSYTQPAYIEVELPTEFKYEVEIIDTWNMTTTKYPEKVSGKCNINLPGTSHLAVICRKIEQ